MTEHAKPTPAPPPPVHTDDNANTSVIIVSYHTGPALWDCLRHALTQSQTREILLVDNGNPPDITDTLHQWATTHPRMRIYSGHGNVGFARACNLGAEKACGEYLLFLNPDSLLPAEGIAVLTQALANRPDAMLSAPRITFMNGREQAGSRRNLLTPWNLLGEGLHLQKLHPALRLNRHHEPLPDNAAEAIPIPAISGACMCLRRSDYHTLGGMDEGYFLHVEDLDLCKRIADKHGVILYVPQVQLRHYLSTSDAPSHRVEYYKACSFTHYMRRHFWQGRWRLLSCMAISAVWLRFGLLRLARWRTRA